MVRRKVAKSLLIASTPILPKMAVRAAKTAEATAQNCQPNVVVMGRLQIRSRAYTV